MKNLKILYLSYLVVLFLHLWEAFHGIDHPLGTAPGPQAARK